MLRYPYNNLEDFTLPSLVKRSVELYKDKPLSAFVGQKSMNYGEFMKKIEYVRGVLNSYGVSKDDKVVLLSENMPNWGVAYFAVTYFGAVVVPVLTDFHISEIHHILGHSDAKAVFVSNKHMSNIEEYNESQLKLVIELDSLEIVDELSKKEYFSNIYNNFTKPNEDDIAAIIYTSGTTGHSKGVMLSHKNLVTNAMSTYTKVNIKNSDVFLSILPLAHTFECTVGLVVPILHGSSIYYIDRTPTPSVLIKSLQTIKPTAILSVPLIIEKIYKKNILAKFNNSPILCNMYKIPFFRKKLNRIAGKRLLKLFGGKLNFFVIGGASLSPFVEEFLIEAKFPYIVGYGLSETAPMLSGSCIWKKTKLKSSGSAMAGVELMIKDINPKTGDGEICAKSPSVMIGYYKDEEKTAQVIKDGWFYTGDLGYIDEDGFLFISGRSKNVIIGSNGENIYPEQIESVINKNKAVLDSLVMQKDGRLTARIYLDYEEIDKMFDTNNNSDSVVADKIVNFLEDMRKEVNSELSSFSKIFKFTQQIEPFLKTPTNKIKRYIYAT